MTIWTLSRRDWLSALRLDPCSYCYGPAGQIDHVIPKSAGGADSDDNIAGACGVCNRVKKGRPLLSMLLRGFPRQPVATNYRKPGPQRLTSRTMRVSPPESAPSMFGRYRLFRDALVTWRDY